MMTWHKPTRRKYLKAAGGAVTVGALSGCLGAGGGDGTIELTAATPGGSWGEWMNEFLFEPWQEESGHKITQQEVGNPESKLIANKKNPVWQLVHVSNTDALQYGKQGLLEPMKEHCENFDQIGDAFKNDYLAGKVATPFGIGVNTNQVDKEVTSWQDLLDPAFKGKVAIPAWDWVGNSWLYVVNDALGGSAEDIQPGLDFVKKMVEDQNAFVGRTNDHVLNLFKNEEVVVAPYWSARTDQIANETQIKTKFVYPEEGAVLWTYQTGLVANNTEEELDAAASFDDFTLRPEVQGKFSSKAGYPPTNPAAQEHLDEEVLKEFPSMEVTEQDMENMAKIDVDWLKVAELRSGHAAEWQKVVAG